MNTKQRLAGKVVVMSGHAALILKPSSIDPNKAWHLPGGIRDNIREPLTRTVCRELEEETGIKAEESELSLLQYAEWPAQDKGEEVIITALFFLLRLEGTRPAVELSEEHEAAAWVTKEELNDYNLAQESKKAIERALTA